MRKSWMDEHKPKGERAYWMRQRTRVRWMTIAKRLGYTSIEGARSAALRYAQRNSLPWPVMLLSRGEIFYSAYSQGESWYAIGDDFGIPYDRAQNAAREWSKIHKKRWPPR